MSTNRFNRIESDCVCEIHLLALVLQTAFQFAVYFDTHIATHIWRGEQTYTIYWDESERFYGAVLPFEVTASNVYSRRYVFFPFCSSLSELFNMLAALLLCVLGVLAIIA